MLPVGDGRKWIAALTALALFLLVLSLSRQN